MIQESELVRGVSDTALWVAYFRAQESIRSDALFRDPYAERLAGRRGYEIATTLPDGNKHEWAWVARTYLFDKFLSGEIQRGADMVVNLAAGLDARPYRMELPASLKWVEVDLPEVVSYKEEILATEEPRCHLRRVALDLSDHRGRCSLLSRLNQEAKRIVVMTEGLLIYFSTDQVGSFAADLAAQTAFLRWIIDLASPGQLKLMQRTTGKSLNEAGTPFKFAPAEGPAFFARYGWRATDVQGLLRTAAQVKRAPTELLSLLPEPAHIIGNYPWTGVCLLESTHA
jgi:methyltransferase (TIGR00027 family)